MTPRGSFQPRPFCDSVILCDSMTEVLSLADGFTLAKQPRP